MADAQMKSQDVPVTIEGKQYTLRYSLKAMAYIQDHYKLDNWQALIERLQDPSRLGPNDLAVMLHAGLRRHHPDVTLEQATDLLDDAGLWNIQALMGEALRASLPGAAEGAEAGEAAADQAGGNFTA